MFFFVLIFFNPSDWAIKWTKEVYQYKNHFETYLYNAHTPDEAIIIIESARIVCIIIYVIIVLFGAYETSAQRNVQRGLMEKCAGKNSIREKYAERNVLNIGINCDTNSNSAHKRWISKEMMFAERTKNGITEVDSFLNKNHIAYLWIKCAVTKTNASTHKHTQHYVCMCVCLLVCLLVCMKWERAVYLSDLITILNAVHLMY